MRNTRCHFCPCVFNDKHAYCEHVVMEHNDQIPENCEPLEFAYALLTGKSMDSHVCVMCRRNKVHFNTETLKYERICEDPKCKEAYVKMMKDRMVNVYGKEHLLNDADMQRKMLQNHADAKDYIWDDQHKFRVVGTYEIDFLDHLKSLDWSPADICAPSMNDYTYKWNDGTTHIYIPDFYIISLGLEVEIKQGNFDSSFMEHNREIEHLKDLRMKREAAKGGIHYIKIMDKDYTEFDSEYVKSDMNKPDGGE